MASVRLHGLEQLPENGSVSRTSESHSPKLISQVDTTVLPFLGGFGRFQKRLVALTWLPALLIAFGQFSDYFLLAQPDTTCVQPSDYARNGSGVNPSTSPLPSGLFGNATRTESSSSSSARCKCAEPRFELQLGLQQNVVTKISPAFIKDDVFTHQSCILYLFENDSPVDSVWLTQQWQLVCDEEWKVHIAKFSLLVGSIFGYLLMGAMADWIGRIPVLLVSVLSVLVFGLSVAFSVDMAMFSTLRFFQGFCLAAIRLSLYVLRIELCLPAWRFSMTMVASLVVVGGQLLMPGLAALCRDWQVLQVLIIVPFVLMLPYIWIFPESLRWLLATQHYTRAKRQMYSIARSNRVDTATDPNGILTELERELQQKPKTSCITQLRSTRNLWKSTVVLCVNSLTGYGIHHCFARSVLEGSPSHLHYFSLAGIAMASCLVLCPVVAAFGRRGGLLTFMIITALASLLQLGLLSLIGKYSLRHNVVLRDTLNQRFSVAFSIIGMFSSHAVSTLSIFYCTEITPTVIRGGGVGLVLASAGFGMLTAPLMELHNQKGFFLHHVILTCCTLLCIICIPLLPETTGQPLPESLAEGEGLLRRPLLPGEQHHLLARQEVREYSRVQDTPLHQIVNPSNSTGPGNSTANGVRT
ncbi:Solute carrier family 22 member 23 [Bagarius yarrelli]|uniref:Solute carrier family 22 member 23 n=1 Tax=Bagarius yarrelli TaxID=175774 RepID=A0A556TZI0_BAGYA|nr:Solute carrier family 22 member 23 [Bagarius yarrelli]